MSGTSGPKIVPCGVPQNIFKKLESFFSISFKNYAVELKYFELL